MLSSPGSHTPFESSVTSLTVTFLHNSKFSPLTHLDLVSTISIIYSSYLRHRTFFLHQFIFLISPNPRTKPLIDLFNNRVLKTSKKAQNQHQDILSCRAITAGLVPASTSFVSIPYNLEAKRSHFVMFYSHESM